jgi:hypothetical protein
MYEIYIIVEDNQAYPYAYTNYKDALGAVKRKYHDLLNNNDEDTDNDINEIPENENTKSHVTELYIEKGININIFKIPVKSVELPVKSKRKILRRHSIGGRYYKKSTQSNKTKKNI